MCLSPLLSQSKHFPDTLVPGDNLEIHPVTGRPIVNRTGKAPDEGWSQQFLVQVLSFDPYNQAIYKKYGLTTQMTAKQVLMRFVNIVQGKELYYA